MNKFYVDRASVIPKQKRNATTRKKGPGGGGLNPRRDKAHATFCKRVGGGKKRTRRRQKGKLGRTLRVGGGGGWGSGKKFLKKND